MNHVLEIDGVQLQFGERKILSDIYLRCETGKITGLLGRNGQGKSCLMNAIYGSLSCEKSVRVDRVAIPNSFKRPGLVVYLPQFNFIPKSLSLRRVFNDFEQEYHTFKNWFPELAAREKSSISQFSGGERRLIEIYIIVKSAAQFALLDEPFTHLNPIQIEKAKELLNEEKTNKGLLITDQMYEHVVDVCDHLYLLVNGKTHVIKRVEDFERLGYVCFRV